MNFTLGTRDMLRLKCLRLPLCSLCTLREFKCHFINPVSLLRIKPHRLAVVPVTIVIDEQLLSFFNIPHRLNAD